MLFGVFLIPFSGCLDWAAAKALAGIAVGNSAAEPFLAGMGLTIAGWLLLHHMLEPVGWVEWLKRAIRWLYVAGHELTHALAAWSSGGKVFAIHVEEKGGHVDLSESNAFVALAPYCIPLHALIVVVGYRILVWARPHAATDLLFLALLGGALAFHALMTWETLTQVEQPDLKAAGGALFSWAVISAVNGIVLLLVLKVLFPETVRLGLSFQGAFKDGWWFWSKVFAFCLPSIHAFKRRVVGNFTQ